LPALQYPNSLSEFHCWYWKKVQESQSGVKQMLAEPFCPWQNRAEAGIQDIRSAPTEPCTRGIHPDHETRAGIQDIRSAPTEPCTRGIHPDHEPSATYGSGDQIENCSPIVFTSREDSNRVSSQCGKEFSCRHEVDWQEDSNRVSSQCGKEFS
jgi:hypothetical protein